MTHKRKEAPDTIPRIDPLAPRELAPLATSSGRNYPRAAELASDGAWAAWLQETLAAVLRPAAVAGALSLAACSLAQGSDAPLPPPPIAVAPEAPPCPIPPPGTYQPPTGASLPTTGTTTLVPIPPPPVVTPPIESVRTAGAVATTSTPPVFVPPVPPPPVRHTRHQQTQQQQTPPPPDPRPMPGGIRPVQMPPQEPMRTAGVPRQVQPGDS